jgi:hypothetical protein
MCRAALAAASELRTWCLGLNRTNDTGNFRPRPASALARFVARVEASTGPLMAVPGCHDPVGRGLAPRRRVLPAGDEPPPYLGGLAASDCRDQGRWARTKIDTARRTVSRT